MDTPLFLVVNLVVALNAFVAQGQVLDLPADTHLTVSVGSQAIGSFESTFENQKENDCVVSRDSFSAVVESFGLKMSLTTTTELNFSSTQPHRLLSGVMIERTDDEVNEIRFELTEGNQYLVVLGNGKKEKQTLEYTLEQHLSGHQFLMTNPSVGDVAQIATFDIETFSVSKERWELTEVKRIEKRPQYTVSVKDTEGEDIGVWVYDSNGSVASANGIMGFASAKKTESKPDSDLIWKIESVKVNSEVNLLEVEDCRAITARIGNEFAIGLRDDPSGQRIIKDGEDYRLVLYPYDPEKHAAPNEKYLLGTKEFPKTSDKVVQIAEKFSKRNKGLKQVGSLVRFVSDYIDDEGVKADVLTAIRDRKGDCTTHAALFNTLARALGYPCRTVGGLAGEREDSLGWHAWNQIYVNGRWWNADATFCEFPASPLHIVIDDADARHFVETKSVNFELEEKKLRLPHCFNQKRSFGYLKEVCDIGPRPAGSDGSRKLQQYIRSHFLNSELKFDAQKFKVKSNSGHDAECANLTGRLNPECKDRVLLACHYDTLPFPSNDSTNPTGEFIGANDGASGVALLCELANVLAKSDVQLGIDFVFFDAEEFVFTSRDRLLSGSIRFARNYKDSKTRGFNYKAAIVVDMIGDKDLSIVMEEKSRKHGRSIMRGLWDQAYELGVKEFSNVRASEIEDDHLPLSSVASIPVCLLIDPNYPNRDARSYWHTTADTPDKCSPDSLGKVGKVMLGWIEMVDFLNRDRKDEEKFVLP